MLSFHLQPRLSSVYFQAVSSQNFVCISCLAPSIYKYRFSKTRSGQIWKLHIVEWALHAAAEVGDYKCFLQNLKLINSKPQKAAIFLETAAASDLTEILSKAYSHYRSLKKEVVVITCSSGLVAMWIMALDPQVSSIDIGAGKQYVSALSPGRYSRKQLRANLQRNMARMMRYVSTKRGGLVIKSG